MKVKPSSV